MEPSEYIIGFGILILISMFGGWLATRRRRIKREEGLRRKVTNEEITSISTWMEANDSIVNQTIN